MHSMHPTHTEGHAQTYTRLLTHTHQHTHTKTQIHTNTVYSQILTLNSHFLLLQPTQSTNYNTLNCTNFLNFYIYCGSKEIYEEQCSSSSRQSGMGWDPPGRNHTEKSRCFDVVHKRSQWRGKKFQRIMMTSWERWRGQQCSTFHQVFGGRHIF